VLPRLPYLALSSIVAVSRLLPVSGSEKDIEILALRHYLAILQRQIDKPGMTGTDRAFLAAPAPAWARPAATTAVDRFPGHHSALAP
jgi:putative transposase